MVQILVLWPLTDIFSTILPGVLVSLANNDRLQNNTAALKINPLLEEAAALKAQDMAAKGYFDHTSPEGVTPWFWLEKVGYRFSGAGENLAINFSDSAQIENAWMNSPTHRANVLDKRFSEIGIATAKGMYQGRETVFVVQFFGWPKTAVNQALTPAKSSSPKPKATPSSEALATPESQAEIAAASPSVGAQSVAIDNQPQETFAASGTVAGIAGSRQEAAVGGANLAQQWLSMPKAVAQIVYLGIAGVFLLALVLKIFVKIKIQYPRLIFNGVVVLFVAISLLYLNHLIIGQGLQSQIFIFN